MSQLKTIQDENLPIWLPRLAVHGGPRFLQIADALQAAVVDGSLKPGDPVNLEADLIAKYVEKMLHPEPASSSITIERLVAQGF